jgi:hypothetical protein
VVKAKQIRKRKWLASLHNLEVISEEKVKGNTA